MSDEFTRELSEWLVKEQPISLSVNGPINLALRQVSHLLLGSNGIIQLGVHLLTLSLQDVGAHRPGRILMGYHKSACIVLPSSASRW